MKLPAISPIRQLNTIITLLVNNFGSFGLSVEVDWGDKVNVFALEIILIFPKYTYKKVQCVFFKV